MTDYRFKLLPATGEPRIETAFGQEDDEVLDLAMIRLAAAPDLVAVEVWSTDRLIGGYRREGGPFGLTSF